MGETDGISTESAEPEGIHTPLGDRFVVALAALALVGGLLIAGSNLLHLFADDGTAATSPEATTQASSTIPAPSPTPRALREVTVIPSTPQPTEPSDLATAPSWLEAVSMLVVLSAPSESGTELARLQPGDVVLVGAADDNGWIGTLDPVGEEGALGFIDGRDAPARAGFRLYPVDRAPQSGGVISTWASPAGLLGWGWLPGQENSMWSGFWNGVALTSVDGERWQLTDADPELLASWQDAVWGPSGWLAIGNGYSGSESIVWNSYDGISWERLGRLSGLGAANASSLAGSDRGYVMASAGYGSGGQHPIVWYSPDGIVWEEAIGPFGESRRLIDTDVQLLATDHGFVAWTLSYDDQAHETLVAFSPDGLVWRPVEMEDASVFGVVQLAEAGGVLLGVEQEPDGSMRAWRGDLAASETVSLLRDPRAESAFDGFVNLQLASNGAEAAALAYDPVAGVSSAWTTTGWNWAPVRIPDSVDFGPYPRLAAVGPSGPVVIGSRPSAAGDNPIFWHLRDDGRWVSEVDPVIPFVSDPTPDDCGALPTTGLAFALLPSEWGSICFPGQAMHFTTYAAPCYWCSEDDVGGTPSWLMRWSPAILLQPSVGEDHFSKEGYLAPSVDDGDWSGNWVRVTGQYAHPDSDRCAWSEEQWDGQGWYNTVEAAIEFCRERFVVTELTVVDGP